ncbi:DinB superfamily protein [Catalinimonas alkaloidigena]|uniref:DinB superfamily protein n=1 Tax=Catalinimonas alkaloidigena TaxID=1075417 RepID=A0A1G9R921_9BACT|nr:DinB family protein [Catalinimonas alkaloidigena]SDM19779.1 DinB superfamily protein [Catalinimonas alkaloidigena]
MLLIEQLQRTQAETLSYFEASEPELRRSYGPGKWNVRYLLHHLADAESMLLERIKRIISEPHQILWSFDQDAWAEHLHYARRPLILSRNLYTACRNQMIYYARLHYEANGHLQFVHSEMGMRTLKEEFEKVAGHNQHHLEQIREALLIQPRFIPLR